jgi:integrase
VPPPLRVHDLRHTAASLMIASGGDVKIVQQQLGDRTATMTLDLYTHLFPTSSTRSRAPSTASRRGLLRILCGLTGRWLTSVTDARSG